MSKSNPLNLSDLHLLALREINKYPSESPPWSFWRGVAIAEEHRQQPKLCSFDWIRRVGKGLKKEEV